MELQEHVISLITQLGTTLRTPELELDVEGECALELGDAPFIIRLDEATGQLVFISAIAELSEGEAQDILIALLQANGVYDDTRGACFCLDEDAEVIMLRQMVNPLQLEFPDFYALFEGFVAVTITWRDALPEIASGERTDVTVPVKPDVFSFA